MVATALSAPGKVLFSGGYLVLDRNYTGLVFGLDARIYVLIEDAGEAGTLIHVRSPQFYSTEWLYDFIVPTDTKGVQIIPRSR